MDALLATVIRPTDPPLICAQDDGTWNLDLPDAEATIILSTDQVLRIVDDFLSQELGGPEEAD